ncbi:hypothetical protein P8452_13105 [Trifolium repens]|nr:hypothetical protein P8452_13105 [Trifolium repens]
MTADSASCFRIPLVGTACIFISRFIPQSIYAPYDAQPYSPTILCIVKVGEQQEIVHSSAMLNDELCCCNHLRLSRSISLSIFAQPYAPTTLCIVKFGERQQIVQNAAMINDELCCCNHLRLSRVRI